MQVTYYDECKWVDVGEGLNFDFVNADGTALAKVALRDGNSKLWSFEVFLPQRFQINGTHPAGIVYSQAAARRVAETILLNSIVTK